MLTGSDFSLVFIMCMLFVIAQICFMWAISTSVKTASSGKVITILVSAIPMLLGKVHQALTLSPHNSQPILKHLFSLVPFSAFQMVLMSQCEEMKLTGKPFGWRDLHRDMSYPTGWGLIWLPLDAIIYFAVFLICNALNDREFGHAPIGWRGLFKAESWRRLFTRVDTNVGRLLQGASRMINVQGLRKVYSDDNDVSALDGIDFSVGPGETIVVIGANGAGKSTLINILAGAIESTEGNLSLAGMPCSFRDVTKQLGIVLQENAIIPLLSVREHLHLAGAFRGISLVDLCDAIEVFATTLELTEVLDSRAGTLSESQKRKLCIAICLLGSPPIVLMDEPTAGVDDHTRHLIWKTIASLEETTTVVTTHALEEAEAVSSRLFIASKGKLPFCGTPAQIRNRFKCGYVLRLTRDDGATGDVLTLVQSFVPGAHLAEDTTDTIALPIHDSIPALLAALSERQEELGIHGYSLGLEQLEDMILKLTENDEAEFQRS
jgi:ABC-type multidrug transport system ATPase subunit